MAYRIVPNVLRDRIYERIDAAIAVCDNPENAALGREHFYESVLDYFDEHGTIPEISLVNTETRKEN